MPLSVRHQYSHSNKNQFRQTTKTDEHKLAVTSCVSQTESKLIIALKKQLVEAKALLEQEHLVKLRLVEGARHLKA